MTRGDVCLLLKLDSDHFNVTFEHDKEGDELLLLFTVI